MLRAATLEVAEAALTGESLPVSKGVDAVGTRPHRWVTAIDMVYMNTNVTRGSGAFVVTATGMATEVGHISGLLPAEESVTTPLTRQLDRLTRQILWIAGVALVVSMVLEPGAAGDTFTAVFTAAVAFAIGALPENLPAVVTTILAYGTQALAKAGAIMKRLQSTETLGSTSAINSDKTGHAHAQPDDRGSDGYRRAAGTPSRAAAIRPRADHPGRWAAEAGRGRVPAADGAHVRRGGQTTGC